MDWKANEIEVDNELPAAEPVAPAEPVSAKTLEEQLAELEQLLRAQEEAVKSADEQLRGAAEAQKREEARRKALEDRKKAVGQLVNQVKTIRDGLAPLRQAALAALEDAEDYLGELADDLKAELSDAYRQHIAAAFAEADYRITDLEGDAEARRQAVSEAEEAKVATQAEVTRMEVAAREVQTELQQLGGRIQAAMAAVAQARSATETARQKGQGGETFLLGYGLAAAVEDLRRVSDSQTEQNLRDALDAYRQATTIAREKLATTQDKLDEKKADLREKENELQAAKKQRAASIQKKVRDFPEEDMRSEPSAATTGTA
ncbi:MAG: hypothetical protein JXA93_04325 [Anaerolineae bacterium]|nr:hypothetical protein [Anaerolineae bacterium]